MAVEAAVHTIVHYEIPANDANALKAFYGSVFDWEFSTAPGMDDYFMVDPAGTRNLAIAVYPRQMEGSGPTNYVSVEDVKKYAAKITAAGGQMIHTFTVTGMGHGAVGLDPEGNMIGLWQSDSAAKES